LTLLRTSLCPWGRLRL